MNELIDHNWGSSRALYGLFSQPRWSIGPSMGSIIASNVAPYAPESGYNAVDYTFLRPTRQMEFDLIRYDLEQYDLEQSARAQNQLRALTYRNLRRQANMSAPLWLLLRMETLRNLPPPTLQQVRTQFKASAEVQQKSGDRLTI